MDISLFLQFLINGVALGSLYALLAIGFTIIFGVVGLINIAHGDFFMMAAFLAMWGVMKYNHSLVHFLCSCSSDHSPCRSCWLKKSLIGPLRKMKTSSFIGAISISFLLQNLFVVLFTARSKPFPHPAISRRGAPFRWRNRFARRKYCYSCLFSNSIHSTDTNCHQDQYWSGYAGSIQGSWKQLN